MNVLKQLYLIILCTLLPGCFSKPVPEIPHTTPEATRAWYNFIQENKEHQNYAWQHNLPVFSGIVKVTTSPSYRTLHALQDELARHNKNCAQFYQHPQLHMSLIYFNIPIEHTKPFDEAKLTGELTRDINELLQEFAPVLETVNFEYVGTQILGKNNNFIVATFHPAHGVTNIEDTFILPFGTMLFKKHKHAWLGFLDTPTFHISLAKIKPECSAQSIVIPHNLPSVHTYPLKTGTLKVSLHGPTKKPYHKKVPGWRHRKFIT